MISLFLELFYPYFYLDGKDLLIVTYYTTNRSAECGFQRVLLTTDGSVTQMIESYFLEQIMLAKVSENVIYTDQYIGQMELSKGAKIINRKIFLQGKISRRKSIYAESIIALERLEENFREELLKTKNPIGKIWKK